MGWTVPRTWEAGDFRGIGVPSELFNLHVPDNLQFIFDTFTDVRGKYKDMASAAVPGTEGEIVRMTLDTRFSSVNLTLVGVLNGAVKLTARWTGGSEVLLDSSYTNTPIGKQWILSLADAGRQDIWVTGVGGGTIAQPQFDIKELA